MYRSSVLATTLAGLPGSRETKMNKRGWCDRTGDALYYRRDPSRSVLPPFPWSLGYVWLIPSTWEVDVAEEGLWVKVHDIRMGHEHDAEREARLVGRSHYLGFCSRKIVTGSLGRVSYA